MTSFTFRLATPDDADHLSIFVNRAYRGDSSRLGWTTEADLLEGQRTDSPDILKKISSPYEKIMLLHEAEKLLGCVYLKKKSDVVAYLGMLSVDPLIQDRGIGREIISRSETWVKENWGSRFMEMTVIEQRQSLIEYYERRGYHRTGEIEPFPMDDVRFGIPKVKFLQMQILRKII